MDYRQIQDILTHDIGNLSKLRERVADGGENLSALDKRALRFQLSGIWLTDIQRKQRTMFVEGAEEDIRCNYNLIFNTLKQLS